MKRKIVTFDLNGGPVHIEVEDIELETKKIGYERVARGSTEKEDGDKRFQDAVAKVKPAAEMLLNTFSDLNRPAEIGLDFGIKFNAKVGAVFASADSEATFKVSLKWNNKAAGEKKE